MANEVTNIEELAKKQVERVEKAAELEAKKLGVEAEKLVDVMYLGFKRLEHTLTGKVFHYGTKHTMTESQAEDLYRRTAGEPLEITPQADSAEAVK